MNEYAALKKLLVLHERLVKAAVTRLHELNSALLESDKERLREAEKLDALSACGLVNTRAASFRLRDLQARRERLLLDIHFAKQEQAKLQKVLERLYERQAGHLPVLEEQAQQAMLEDFPRASPKQAAQINIVGK